MPTLAISSPSEDQIQAAIVQSVGLSAEQAREALAYDPETGSLTWRRSFGSRAVKGRIAGCVRSDGYRLIGLHGQHYMAHRLAWLIVYGAWPSEQIDHINMDPRDNRLANLRDVSQSLNQANVRARSCNTVGLKGVSRTRSGKRFRARIHTMGREINLGQFATAEEAHEAYAIASKKYFGVYARSS